MCCICYLGIYLFIFKPEFLVKLLSSRTRGFWGKKTAAEICGEAAAVGSFAVLGGSACEEGTRAEQGLPASPREALGPGRSCSRRAPGQGEGAAGPAGSESLSLGGGKKAPFLATGGQASERTA